MESDCLEPLVLFWWKWAKSLTPLHKASHGSVEADTLKLLPLPSYELAFTNYSFNYGCVTGLDKDLHNNQSPRNYTREKEYEKT